MVERLFLFCGTARFTLRRAVNLNLAFIGLAGLSWIFTILLRSLRLVRMNIDKAWKAGYGGGETGSSD
jgi:hypothetical protein